MNVIVVGARPGSLGEEIARTLSGEGNHVRTWGLDKEDSVIDIAEEPMGALRRELAQYGPDHIICTAGINRPERYRLEDDPRYWYEEHFDANVLGPMRLLEAWCSVLDPTPRQVLGHYVAISSNSAHVPRSGSAAYCASKAALSQALRCKARELLGGDRFGVVAYGYEPGLLTGTPMTEETEQAFPGQSLTRMRGDRLAAGIPTATLARVVVNNLHTGAALNGVLVPFDAGER